MASNILIGLLTLISLASAPRFDRWEVIGPGGGGGQFIPTVSPHNPNDLLEACDMTGSYISHDAGRTWRMFNLGDRTQFFVFDPVDSSVIYAKTMGTPASVSKDRPLSTPALWRSADAGKTWRGGRQDSSAAGEQGEITALAVDPDDSRVLFAAMELKGSAGLYVSTDWGKNWDNAGLLADGGQAIYVDPRSSKAERTLYVAGSSSVMVREHGHWSRREVRAETTQGRVVSAGFPDGGTPVLYAIAEGVLLVSEDGARTWRQSTLPSGSAPLLPRTVATSLHHPDVAYVSYSNDRHGNAASFGVAKTSDRGRTWKLVWNESMTSAPNIHDSWMSEVFGPSWGGNPIDLGVAPTNPNICFGTDYGRTLRTNDGGETWQGIYSSKLDDGTYTTTGLDVTTNYGVHFDPFASQRMFIAYTDIGLFRSENGGKSWSSSTQGVPEQWTNTTYSIVFDPEVRGRVWGAMSGVHDLPRSKMWGLRTSAATFRGGVCQSADGGKTWTISNAGMPEAATTHILLDPKSPANARVLYSAALGRGVYKSIDGGDHWVLKNTGIQERDPSAWRLVRDSNGVLYLVVVRRNDDGSIGGEGDGALYRSTDGAEHWTRVGLPASVNGPHGLAVDPQDPHRLYLAAWGRRPDKTTMGGGIYLSTDSGATWHSVFGRDQYVYDVTIDPREPKILYACGFSSSAWRSADRGESWQRINGFNFKWGHRVIPDPVDASKIYVTTYGGGVWHGPATGDVDASEDVVPDRVPAGASKVGSSRVDLQACKLEYSIVSPK